MYSHVSPASSSPQRYRDNMHGPRFQECIKRLEKEKCLTRVCVLSSANPLPPRKSETKRLMLTSCRNGGTPVLPGYFDQH
jgi:hypothetical protein